MSSSIPYSLAFVGIILTASLAVLGQDDPCLLKKTCEECVETKINVTVGNNGTCIFEIARDGRKCVDKADPTEGVFSMIFVKEACAHAPTPTPQTTTTVSPSQPTTNATTPAPTPTPSTNATTTAAPSPTPVTNATTTTTTPAPPTNGTSTVAPSTNGTTTVPPTPTPTPAPKKGGFAWGEFIGGIVFAIAISSLAYLIWRFYKARLDRNYHTFSNPTF